MPEEVGFKNKITITNNGNHYCISLRKKRKKLMGINKKKTDPELMMIMD